MSLLTDASAKLQQGEIDAGLSLLAEAYAAAPRTCHALAEIADLYQQAGDLDRAEAIYLEAVNLPPDESTYNTAIRLGTLLVGKRQPQRAAHAFRLARERATNEQTAIAAAELAANTFLSIFDHQSAIEEALFLKRLPSADQAKLQQILVELFCTEYHKWYYNSGVWANLTFAGVPCLKFPTDMWNYQEIISTLRPSLVVEFGTFIGGATLYYSTVLQMVNPASKVLSVDVDHTRVPAVVKANPHIELLTRSSADPAVQARIAELRREYPGPIFAIADSLHDKAHVLAELELLRPVLRAGDYLVVEDSNVNGHPVRPDYGEGPMEAMMEYGRRHPEDYRRDEARELKFGVTAAPRGYLIRN